MSSHQQHPLGGLKRPDAIDEVFGRANPNPERIGCPSHDVLVALTRRARPISDPAYDHLGECSPCYLEVRALKEAADERRRRVMTWAAVLMLAGGAVAWVLATRRLWRTSGSIPLRALLDLRPYASASGEPQRNPSRLVLPRARLALTLLLPAGSVLGSYQVEVRDSNAMARVSVRGEAERRNAVTALELVVNLGDVEPGAYNFALRGDGAKWQMFPLRLQ